MTSAGDPGRLPRVLELFRYCVLPSDDRVAELDAPDREAVLEFMQSLDGRTVDQVVAEIELPGGVLATIYVDGGGDAVGFIILLHGSYHRLTTGLERSGVREIQSGGIPTEVPDNQLVPISLALEVASEFLSTGELSNAHSWETSPLFA